MSGVRGLFQIGQGLVAVIGLVLAPTAGGAQTPSSGRADVIIGGKLCWGGQPLKLGFALTDRTDLRLGGGLYGACRARSRAGDLPVSARAAVSRTGLTAVRLRD